MQALKQLRLRSAHVFRPGSRCLPSTVSTYVIGPLGVIGQLVGTRLCLLAVSGVLTAWLVLPGIHAPWGRGYDDWEGAFYSIIGRERVKDGLLTIAAPPTPAAGDMRIPYLNHPPLTGLLVGAAFWASGTGELQTRVVPLLASLGTLILFYALVARSFSRPVAQASTIALLSMPMLAIYADLPSDLGPILLCVAFVVLICLQRYLAGHTYALPAGAAAAAVGFFEDYAIVFVLIGLLAASIVAATERKRVLIYTIVLAGAVGLSATAFLLYTTWHGGSPIFLLELVSRRTGIGAVEYRSDVVAWVARMAKTHVLLFSPLVLVSVLVSGLHLLRYLRDRQTTGELWIVAPYQLFWIAALFLFGSSYVLVGHEGAYVHPYWTIYLMPGYALLVGLYWERLLQQPASTGLHTWAWLLALPYTALFLSNSHLHSRAGAAATVAAGLLLLLIRRSRHLPLVALLVFVGLNGLISWKTLQDQATNEYREHGNLIRQVTARSDLIVSTGNAVPQLLYYSERLVVPNSIGLGKQLEGRAWLNERDLDSLSRFVQLHQPLYLYLDGYTRYVHESVLAWLDKECAYRFITSYLIYIERC